MKLETMMDLYTQELKDLHSAEKQLTKALPKLAKSAANEQLRDAFLHHLEQTHEHVNRLERIFASLGKKPGGHKCVAMEGIIDEGGDILSAAGDDHVRDAGLIAAAQRSEHYEIAAYGCAKTYAKALGRDIDADLLDSTLEEEKETDQKLTELAQGIINPQALAAAK